MGSRLLGAQTPDRKELRDFGVVTGSLFAVIFGLLLPYLRHRAFPLWPWVLCAWLVSAALIAPRTLKYVYRLWTALGVILGWINSRIIMTGVYYIAIVPTGLIMRLVGRDLMARKFDSTAVTYRVASRQVSRENLDRTV